MSASTGLSPRFRPRLDLTGNTVVVLEDDPDSLEVLRQMLAAFNATVLEARNGAEGMRLLARVRPPQLILCDLMMPVVNGFQFMDWLVGQPRLCRIPVVAVTALGSPVDMMRTWSAGFSGHLVKPVDLHAMEVQLQRVFWAHHAQGPQTAPMNAG